MATELKEALLLYSEGLPDGHPLKDIALTTLKELGRENPFGRNKEASRVKNYQIVNERTGISFISISDACYSLGPRGSNARNDLRKVLRKYNLKLL